MRVFPQSSQTAVATNLVSVVIALTLGLQLYASLLADLTVTRQIPVVRKLNGPALWPVLDHPMFRSAHYPGDRLGRHFLFVILDDSTEIPIGREDFAYWQLRVLQRNIAEGDSARIAEFVQGWESRHQRRLRGLRLENHPLVFTGSSVEEGPREILRDLALPVPTEPLR